MQLESDWVQQNVLKRQYKQFFEENKELMHYFNEVALEKFKNPPSVMIVTSVESITKVARTGLQVVHLNFKTDIGDMALSLAIKEFPSVKDANYNKELSKLLHDRLSAYGEDDIIITTPKVISQNNNFLIYEGVEGHTFLESTRNYYEKGYSKYYDVL